MFIIYIILWDTYMTQIPRALRSEAKLCGLYEVHLYIDYIKNNIL